jgi:hypothetical protein
LEEIDRELSNSVRSLFDSGKVTSLRVAIAATKAALPNWDALGLDSTLPQRALRSAEEWAACPCPNHAAASGRLAKELRAYLAGDYLRARRQLFDDLRARVGSKITTAALVELEQKGVAASAAASSCEYCAEIASTADEWTQLDSGDLLVPSSPDYCALAVVSAWRSLMCSELLVLTVATNMLFRDLSPADSTDIAREELFRSVRVATRIWRTMEAVLRT